MTMTTEQPQPPVSDERALGRIEATLESMKENMATKADLEKLRIEMATKADLEKLRAEMATKAELEALRIETATKADLEKLRTELAKSEVRVLRWQIGMWITTIMLLLGIFGLILSNGVGG